MAHPQHAAHRVCVIHPKACALAAADAAGVEQFEQSAIAQAACGVGFGFVQYGLHLGLAQDATRQAFGRLGKFELAGGVGQDVARAGEPFEPEFDRGQILQLHANGQRRSVGFAVVEQMALVALDHGLGDLARVVYAALANPRNEFADRLAPRAGGVRAVVADQHPLQVLVHVAQEQAPG